MTDLPAVVEEKITIAVDVDSCTPLTLELAVELAAAVKGQLQGLFIENADLFNTARLPFSCEITFSSGQPRALDTDELERRYKRLADSFHRSLAQKAQQSVVHCSFQSVRSRRKDILAQPQGRGYLILDRSAKHRDWQPAVSASPVRILVASGEDPARLNNALHLIYKKLANRKIELYWVQSPMREGAMLASAPNVAVHPIDAQQAELLLHSALDYLVLTRGVDGYAFHQLVAEASCPVVVVE